MTFKNLKKLEAEFEELKNKHTQLSNTVNKIYVTPADTNKYQEQYSEYLDKIVSPYIENNIELIDDNNFTELYERADSWLTEDFEHLKPYLTDYLLACDINPLEHMKKVPSEYVNGWRELSIKIPDNIEIIEAESLNSHILKHIILPKNLHKLYLHLNIYNDNDLYLHYPGTEADWRSIVVIEGSDGREYDIYITCEEDGYKQKYGKPNIDVSSVAYSSKWDWGSISSALNDIKTRWDLKLDDLKDTYVSYFDED